MSIVRGVRDCLIDFPYALLISCDENGMVVILELLFLASLRIRSRQRLRQVALHRKEELNPLLVAVHLLSNPLERFTVLGKSNGFLTELYCAVDVEAEVGTTIQEREVCVNVICCVVHSPP